MRQRQGFVAITVVLLGLMMALPSAWAGALKTATSKGDRFSGRSILEIPVEFTVQNINRSRVPCAADLGVYTVSGFLVTPTPIPEGVTLYAHGGFLPGQPVFRFKPLPEYDYGIQMARRGHASLILDRLGYGISQKPERGWASCIGSQADILHQIVEALRGGGYVANGRLSHTFNRVALGGHSIGGLIAPVEAYSFGGVDALVVLSAAFEQGLEAETAEAFVPFTLRCAAGGGGKIPGDETPGGGYAFIFEDDETFRRILMQRVDSRVEQLLLPSGEWVEKDSCGDIGSAGQTLATDFAMLSSITIPVLLVFGDSEHDWNLQDAEAQADLYRAGGNEHVTLKIIKSSGHFLMFAEKGAAASFRKTVSDWLDKHEL